MAVAKIDEPQLTLLHELGPAPMLPHTEFSYATKAGFGLVRIDLGDALDFYGAWQSPTVIVSDGGYGVAGFPGDPPTPDGLVAWYAPHVAAWSAHAMPETSLWFWNTEVGWATVHPLLVAHGWEYRTLHIWDKGNGHIAGNVNSLTIRRFPVVTEVCAHYVRRVTLPCLDGQERSLKEWLRFEWARSGLPFAKTNEACRVANAATRKYFTKDHLWYFPPPDMFERLATYANAHGRPTSWPYFSIDGERPLTGGEWATLRSKWHHLHGVTNVWAEPPVRGTERMKRSGVKVVHANQKPLKLIQRIIAATSDPGDTVWEPFGGLCTAAVASMRSGRNCCCAELLPEFHRLAVARIEREIRLVDRHSWLADERVSYDERAEAEE